jgi:hypothetical protein
VSTDLSGPDILMLVNEGIDVIILELLDDAMGDVEVCLVVLATDWLYTCPVNTCYGFGKV